MASESYKEGARAKRAPPFWWLFGARTFQKSVSREGSFEGFWRVFQYFRRPRHGFLKVFLNLLFSITDVDNGHEKDSYTAAGAAPDAGAAPGSWFVGHF